MFRRLTSIVVITFVTVSAIFLISVSLFSYRIFFNFTSKEVSGAQLTLVNEAMRQVSTFITRVRDAGAYIVTNRGLVATFSEDTLDDGYHAIIEQRDISLFLNDVASFEYGIDSIELFTNRYDGFPQVADARVYSLELIRDEPWFVNLSQADNGWLAKHQSPTNGQEVVSYFHRLLDDAGKTQGFVKINVLPQTFFDYMADVELAMSDVDSSLMIFDSGGRLIDERQEMNDPTVLDELLVYDGESNYQLLQEPYRSVTNHYELLGNEHQYLLVISKPTNGQWRLAHMINIDYLYSDTQRVGWFVVLIGIANLLVFIPIAYYVVKRLLKPLDRLIGAMKQVEQGNLQTSVEPGYIEEYQTLANNFNRMTKRLELLLKRIERKNREKREAELRSLQNQIVPHFLYNTLDMIHWRALDYGAEDISFMVSQLSKMFRIGVSQGKTFIILRDELEHAQAYLDIQTARLNKKINYQVNVRPTLKEIYVPKVILQPIIENSMKHGFPEANDVDMKIAIDIYARENELEIVVSDNGIGFPEGWQIDQSEGIGLKNIQNRIQLYFGPNYGLEIDELASGAMVRLKLPLIEDIEELEEKLNHHYSLSIDDERKND